VKPEDQAPSEELRVSGGLFQEGDFGRRFTVGGFADSQFRALLAVRGNGIVELVGRGQRDDVSQRLYPMIQATGSIELPPVNPDPRDPLFNYLLVLAFINGVLSLSSSLLKITFSSVPPFVETNQNWSYGLTLQNLSLTESLLALNNIETITADQQSAFLRTIPSLPQKIDSQQSTSTTVPHTPQDIPLGGAKLVVSVSVAMRAGSLTVAGRAISPEIPVVQSPVIDLATLTDPIQRGSNNFRPSIENQSGRSLTVNDVSVEGFGTVQHPTPPLSIPAGSARTTGVVNIPASSFGTGKTIKVTISYRWDGTNISNSLSASKIITIT
jgi:hypothetical protein